MSNQIWYLYRMWTIFVNKSENLSLGSSKRKEDIRQLGTPSKNGRIEDLELQHWPCIGGAAHQKPLMPASTDLPWEVRNPVLRPPGEGDASKRVTTKPNLARACAAPKPAQPPPTTTAVFEFPFFLEDLLYACHNIHIEMAKIHHKGMIKKHIHSIELDIL